MVFYFSATGNSRYVAEKAAAEFGMDTVDITAALRRGQFSYEAGGGEKIIFVMPVYFWGLPAPVMDFLRQLEFTGASKAEACVILTCGSSAGGSDRMFAKAMEGKNCVLKGAYSIVMPDNFVLMLQAPNPEAQVMLLRKAEKAMAEIFESIRFNYRKGYRSGLGARIGSKGAYLFYRKMRGTRKFWVQESCIGCGLCQTVCPSAAVTMEEGRPVWVKDTCAWCTACINRCPAAAIQYGKKSEKKGRYVHPILK